MFESEISFRKYGEIDSVTPTIVFEFAEWKASNLASNWIDSSIILG